MTTETAVGVVFNKGDVDLYFSGSWVNVRAKLEDRPAEEISVAFERAEPAPGDEPGEAKSGEKTGDKKKKNSDSEWAPKFESLGKQAGQLAKQIIKGTKPSALGVVSPSSYYYSYNGDTGVKIELGIPSALLKKDHKLYKK